MRLCKLVGVGAGLLLAGLLFSSVAAMADAWPSFDCAALLKATQGRSSNEYSYTIYQAIDGHSFGPNKDAVNLIEMLAGNKPLLARSEAQSSAAAGSVGNLICSLIIVELRHSTGFDLRDANGPNDKASRIPILLVNVNDTPETENLKFNNWAVSYFQISTIVENISDMSGYNIKSSDFRGLQYSESGEKSRPQQVLFVSLKDNRSMESAALPEPVSAFLAKSGAADASEMIFLCMDAKCPDPASLPSALISGIDSQASVQQIGQQTALGGGIGNTPTAPGSERAGNLPPPLPPSQPTREAPPRGKQETVTLSYVKLDGNESFDVEKSFTEVGGLKCVLHATGADIFVNPPSCEGEAFYNLEEKKPKIEIAEDGHWKVIADPRRSVPKPIEVTLPRGASATQCFLDATYTAVDGSPRTIKLEPIPQSNPARHASKNPVVLPSANNRVGFSLKVNSEAYCGGPGRYVELPADADLAVPLVPGRRAVRSIAYVSLFDKSDLNIALRLGNAGQALFAEASFDAIHAAHARISATYRDRLWGLVSAAVIALQSDGKLDSLLTLNATDIKTDVDRVFSAVRPAALESIAGSRLTVSADMLQSLMGKLTADAGRGGFDHLTVVLVGPIADRDVNGLKNPCNDVRYVDLAANLNQGYDPVVDVFVFPIVGLEQNDAPGYSWGGQSNFPGGIHSCRTLTPHLQIHPFYIEPWRASVDAIPRFSTALADQLGGLLESLLPQGDIVQ